MRNVLRVDLYDTSTEEDIHINQLLIDEGFAMFQEESHASRVIYFTGLLNTSHFTLNVVRGWHCL